MGKTRICEELRNAYKILVRKPERKKTLWNLDMYGMNMEFCRKKFNMRMRIELNSITVQSSGRFSWTQ
jgi:hypothetical protein